MNKQVVPHPLQKRCHMFGGVSMEHGQKPLINDRGKHEVIERAHLFLKKLLDAIEKGDLNKINQLFQETNLQEMEKAIDLFKRVPGDPVRSLKNHLISTNTLFAYCAERGGLPAWKSHYLSEKYAILIENSNTIEQLEQIREIMFSEYFQINVHIEKQNQQQSIAQRAREFINYYYYENYTIKEIAAELNVNPSHLMRSFKHETGLTISQYRNQRRVNAAKEFLIFTDMPIIDIAITIGFTNHQHFTRVFKEFIGMSPAEYRKFYHKR